MPPDFNKPTLLYGGSFDPLHLGHVAIADFCRKQIQDLEQVVFLPCAISPGKAAPIASGTLRLAWLNSFCESTPTTGIYYSVWSEELDRGGTSYTIDTLRRARSLGAIRENLYFLVGADAYCGLSTWKDAEHLRGFCRIVVADRPGSEPVLTHHDDITLKNSPIALSSSDIRAALRSGSVPENVLPDAVSTALRTVILNSDNPYAK